MSITLALALASASAAPTEQTCSWDHPGRNPYRGSSAAAIDRYTDIPPDIARTLKRRMAEHQPDDKVIITRDAIRGREQYAPEIRDMHFGAASVCHSVTRTGWDVSRQEPAAVYCVGSVCILVPRICGNVSRITRLEAPARASTGYYGAAPAQAPAGATAAPPAARTASGASTPAATRLAPLHAAMPAAPAPETVTSTPELELGEPAMPPEVAQTETDGTERNRLPGRTVVSWKEIDGAWHNPGRADGGGGGGGGGGSGGGNIPSPVPEPAAGAMLLAGLAGLAVLAVLARLRRRDKKS